MIAFIDAHRHRVTTDGMVWGVEPICAQLQIAPSTYYAHATKAPRPVRSATHSCLLTSDGSTPSTTASTASARSGCS